MASAHFLHSFFPFTPFDVREYVLLHAPCLDVKRFRSMPLDEDRNLVYDIKYGVDRLSVIGG